MHVCQHYDGDGWGGATMTGAIERLKRFSGRDVFHTDNPGYVRTEVAQAMAAAGMRVVSASSGLHAHDCAMFLDDRPSTVQLRRWFLKVTSNPPPR